jgi:hypothetical protein
MAKYTKTDEMMFGVPNYSCVKRLGSSFVRYRKDEKTTVYRLHQTDIVEIKIEKGRRFVTLRTGGWDTRSTQEKMNYAMKLEGVKYYVVQKQFKWYVTDWQGYWESFDKVHEFKTEKRED